MANILIVHNQCEARRFLCSRLFQGGHTVECVARGRSLFDVLSGRKDDFDVVILRLDGSKKDTWHGKDSVEVARAFGAQTQFLVINGEVKDLPSNVRMLRVPFTDEMLLAAVEDSIKAGEADGR